MSRVLIIDDDPTLLRIVEVTLEEAGHQATVCENSQEALELLEDQLFEAVILDLAMPAPDGFEVLQRIRAKPALRSVPVLILSGRSDPGDGARGIRAGADDYVTKPFEASELVVRIERLIERSRTDATALVGRLEALHVADLLQNLCQGNKTGLLHVADGAGDVEVHIEQGKILHAQHGNLRGAEALLVLLEKETGVFRFEPGSPQGVVPPPEEPLDLNGILLDAAWLEDEVTRRLQLLPGAGQLLQAVPPLPPAPAELACIDLPFVAVYQHLVESAPMGYAQLLESELAAPKKVALTLTMLIEAGAVQARLRPPTSELEALSPTTASDAEQTPETRVDLATTLGQLRRQAREHRAVTNGDQETLHLMVFYDPPVWDRLLEIVEAIPQSSLPGERARLLNQLQIRRSGTLRLVEQNGESLVHLQPLQNKSERAGLFISFASAMVAWLEDPGGIPRLAKLVESFTETRNPFGIIAPHLAGQLRTALKGVEPLHIAQDEPRDLSDLLRALPIA